VSDGRTIRFATVALLTGVAAFFAVRAWGFGERLETGAIAQIDQKDHTGAAISPFGAQLIGFRRSGLKLTVWTWALEAGKVRNQRAIDLAPQDGDAESPPFAISQDASRITWPAAAAVRIEEFATPSRGAIRLDRTRPLTGLAFADSDHLDGFAWTSTRRGRAPRQLRALREIRGQ